MHLCKNCSTRISYQQETTNRLCIDCNGITTRTEKILRRWRGRRDEAAALSALIELPYALPYNLRIIISSMYSVDLICTRIHELAGEICGTELLDVEGRLKK